MPKYIYEIVKEKEVQRGKIFADSLEEASSQVKKPGWFVASIEEDKDRSSGFGLFKPKPKFPTYDKINFTEHLSSSIGAGTPLQEALEAYIEEGDSKSEIIDTINKDIQRGRKLSEAMGKQPNIFPPLYVALVEAGEISGSLDETLGYVAGELRREHEFTSKVKSAMFYPMLVLSVSLIVVGVVVGVIIPKIADITKNFGTELPFLTRLIISVAEFINKNSLLLLSLLALLVFGILYTLRNENIRSRLSAKLIRSPMVGEIMRQVILSRLLRVLGGCLKYGIQLPKALELCSNVVDNELYKNSCENISKKIVRGQSLSVALADEEKLLFPSIIARTVRGSEKSSNVDAGLLRLSSYYEGEVDRNIKRLTELIEPAMIVFLGFLVGLIALSVITPIYQITSSIK